MSNPTPGKPRPIIAANNTTEVIEESAPFSELAETDRLFILFFLKYTTPSHTLLYFKSPQTTSAAVEFAKRYCTNELNARFVRIEPAIHVID